MEILRWQVGNSLRNYQYIVCDHERNALVIDPLDTTQIGELIRDQKLKVKAILLTHEHNDHAAEAAPLQKAWQVPVYSSQINAGLIKAQVTPVSDGGLVPFSSEFTVRAVETPGHAAGHTAFDINGFFFSGDCLFHGGCGHCRLPGANLEEHFKTLGARLTRLSPDLILMPGHYYAARNLDFCLHVEPQNSRARSLRAKIKSDGDEMLHQTTLKQEKEYNPFFRLANPAIRTRISELTGRNMAEVEDFTVFRELRALRDSW